LTNPVERMRPPGRAARPILNILRRYFQVPLGYVLGDTLAAIGELALSNAAAIARIETRERDRVLRDLADAEPDAEPDAYEVQEWLEHITQCEPCRRESYFAATDATAADQEALEF